MSSTTSSKKFPRSRKFRHRDTWDDLDIPKMNLYSRWGKFRWAISSVHSLPNKMIGGIWLTYFSLDYLTGLMMGTDALLIYNHWFTDLIAYVSFPIVLFTLMLGLAFFAAAWLSPYEQMRWRLQDRIFYEMEEDS